EQRSGFLAPWKNACSLLWEGLVEVRIGFRWRGPRRWRGFGLDRCLLDSGNRRRRGRAWDRHRRGPRRPEAGEQNDKPDRLVGRGRMVDERSDRPIALVTGANRGLGLETARQLQADGY